jgi:hypothetical protein
MTIQSFFAVAPPPGLGATGLNCFQLGACTLNFLENLF